MRKNLVRIAIMMVIVLSVFFITSCAQDESPRERIKRISGVSIPEDAEIIYNYIGSTFSGRAPQYTIFKFKDEPTDFFTSDFSYGGEIGMLSFVYGRMEFEDESEIEMRLKKYACIPDEYLPKWESNYIYYEQRVSKFIYFTELKILIFDNRGY